MMFLKDMWDIRVSKDICYCFVFLGLDGIFNKALNSNLKFNFT